MSTNQSKFNPLEDKLLLDDDSWIENSQNKKDH
jgi:hypothetical protein